MTELLGKIYHQYDVEFELLQRKSRVTVASRIKKELELKSCIDGRHLLTTTLQKEMIIEILSVNISVEIFEECCDAVSRSMTVPSYYFEYYILELCL